MTYLPPMSLADELYCLAFDDRTGRPRVHERTVAVGLAAALLGELVGAGRLDVRDGQIVVLRTEPPADALAHSVLSEIIGQPERDVPTRLAYLAGSAIDGVRKRLELAGVWEQLDRGVFRTHYVCLPVNPILVAGRSALLTRLLASSDEASVSAVMLAGLVREIGVAPDLMWRPGTRAFGLARIDKLVTTLPWSLYHLLEFTRAAVGHATLAPR